MPQKYENKNKPTYLYRITYCGGYVHHAPHVGQEIRMSEEYVKPTIDLLYKLFGDVPSKNWEYISVKDWLSENRMAA